MHPSRLIGSSLLALLFLLGGCATRPINAPITRIDVDRGYTFQNRQKHFKGQDNLVILAFSGEAHELQRFRTAFWSSSNVPKSLCRTASRHT